MEDQSNRAGQYSIKVRKGNWEIEVSAPEKDFVLDESEHLMEELMLKPEIIPMYEATMTQGEVAHLIEPGQSKAIKPQSVNEFFRKFKLQTHQEKILMLGYWCEIKQGQPSFTAEDILSRYKEVRETPPGNIHRDIGNLKSKGLLLSAGKTEEGVAYALTNTGIKEVESRMMQS